MADKNEETHERRFWLVLVCLLALPTVALILLPTLRQEPWFLHLRQAATGGLIAIGVGATVVSMGRKVEYDENADPKLLAKLADPTKLYRTQKITAFVLGLGVLLPILIYAGSTGRFAEFGGFVIAPLILIGPGLLARERIWGKP